MQMTLDAVAERVERDIAGMATEIIVEMFGSLPEDQVSDVVDNIYHDLREGRAWDAAVELAGQSDPRAVAPILDWILAAAGFAPGDMNEVLHYRDQVLANAHAEWRSKTITQLAQRDDKRVCGETFNGMICGRGVFHPSHVPHADVVSGRIVEWQ